MGIVSKSQNTLFMVFKSFKQENDVWFLQLTYICAHYETEL